MTCRVVGTKLSKVVKTYPNVYFSTTTISCLDSGFEFGFNSCVNELDTNGMVQDCTKLEIVSRNSFDLYDFLVNLR